MADAGARRHDLEIVERLGAPFQELVALHVAMIFELDVLREGLRRSERVDHHAMVDDEMDRHLRIDLRRIPAELRHRIAHRGEIDDGRHPGEILHQHPRRAVLDLLGRALLLLPVDQRLDVGAGDGLAVLEAEEILEEHLHREGQAGDVAELGGGFLEGVIGVGFRADLEVWCGCLGSCCRRRSWAGSLSRSKKSALHACMHNGTHARSCRRSSNGGAECEGSHLRHAGLDPASTFSSRRRQVDPGSSPG